MEGHERAGNEDTCRTVLIDADSILYFSCKKGHDFDSVKQRFTEIMLSILTETGCDRYAAFLSDPQSFRKKIGFIRTYKGNRTGRETPELLYALKVYAQREWGFYMVPGFEADDCVSLHRDQGIIASPDKDVLRQIPGKHWNYQRNIWIETTEEDANRFLWQQTASGDSVDGVPGIPGIGEKKAIAAIELLYPNDMPLRVLQMYIEQFGESEGIKSAVDRFKETLDLVYLLKHSTDLERLGLEMPPLDLIDWRSRWDTASRV